MSRTTFVHETAAYALLSRAGLQPPRHGVDAGSLPFEPGQPVVVKGLAEDVWHKSEFGAVHFMPFEVRAVQEELAGMKARLNAKGHRWIEGLVCEQIDIARSGQLPSEAFVSFNRGETGWTILFGFGGLQAEALAELAPPCRWPVAQMTATQALTELEAHLLGRIWLGRLRGTRALTTRDTLETFLNVLWATAREAEAAGLALLELNPVALDPSGQPRPLDAVGRLSDCPIDRQAPPNLFLQSLRAPRRIAVAGVSGAPGGVGRTILENLATYTLPPADVVVIKPGASELLGHPCVPDVGHLLANPVDLLLLALPAPAAAETLSALITQGGGANCVCLVSGGIGDGADHSGLGRKLAALLRETRQAGRWTPAVLGPNFLGHWVPARNLNSSFIPLHKLSSPGATGGTLTLLSQSGAFLLCLQSRLPELSFDLAVALGNQMDVALCDVLSALAAEPGQGPIAAYVEGFGPGELLVAATAITTLTKQGRVVLIYRAARTPAGQAAAASHTGAMASDLVLERNLLERAGARYADTVADFDAAVTWLGACPRQIHGPVGIISNAGFESVNGSDLMGPELPSAELASSSQEQLESLLARHGLSGLVNPRLPLDLTPMAGPGEYVSAASLVLENAGVLVVGMVPFARTIDTSDEGAERMARTLAALQDVHRKPIGVVVDAGAQYAKFREVYREAGLPVFPRMEQALRGLRLACAKPVRPD